MLKVFQVKRGATFSFVITFKNLDQTISTMDFGIKEDYEDESMLIEKSLEDGIVQIDSNKYKVDFSTTDILSLDAGMYVFDLRYTIGSTPSIPLSGYIVVADSVFTSNQGE